MQARSPTTAVALQESWLRLTPFQSQPDEAYLNIDGLAQQLLPAAAQKELTGRCQTNLLADTTVCSGEGLPTDFSIKNAQHHTTSRKTHKHTQHHNTTPQHKTQHTTYNTHTHPHMVQHQTMILVVYLKVSKVLNIYIYIYIYI